MLRSISRVNFRNLLLTAAIFLPAGVAQAQVPCLPGSEVLCVDQGTSWTNATRKAFYSRDQGSQMIPYAWAKALKLPGGELWLADLTRYGYLKDNFRSNGLPVGFTLAGLGSKQVLGMTCSACHTREISRGNLKFRIDGGPALSDFQSLLSDMVDSVGRVLGDDTEWQAFSRSVLGRWASSAQIAKLRTDVELWYLRENTMKTRAYGSADMWGLGRLDAVAMIFNRVAGLDIGPPPSYIIAENIQPADAPVRYPFLWNAGKQDTTQWPGFAGNGTAVTALARNTGEVFGVFGVIHPISPSRWPGNVNFRDINSSSTWGLLELERLLMKIGSPKWPSHFPINTTLAAQGKAVYDAQCASCHAVDPIPPGKPGFPNIPTWATPLQDVGTDSREYDILKREVNPGVLSNFKNPFRPGHTLPNPSKAFDVLKYLVIGSMVQTGAILPAFAEDLMNSKGNKKGATVDKARDILDASMVVKDGDGTFKYESRVMFGIWAAAPYLHNGSVPTLADLLKPASERPVRFALGPVYDPFKIGLSDTQPGNYWRTTTGCDDRNSGNSRCGHEFGTTLPEADKRALLEYMKLL